jgi:hypothetical protein
MVRHATPVPHTHPRDRPDHLRVHSVAEAARTLLPLRSDDAHPLVRGRADLLALPGGASLGCGTGWPRLADENRRRAHGYIVCRHERNIAPRPDPGQSLRGNSLTARRLRLPGLPLCRHARLGYALALVGHSPGGSLRWIPVVCGRLHGKPLRGRRADWLRLRRGGTCGGSLALAPDELADLTALRERRRERPPRFFRPAGSRPKEVTRLTRSARGRARSLQSYSFIVPDLAHPGWGPGRGPRFAWKSAVTEFTHPTRSSLRPGKTRCSRSRVTQMLALLRPYRCAADRRRPTPRSSSGHSSARRSP